VSLPLKLDRLERIWNERHPKSKIIFQQARKVTPGGAHHTNMIDRWPTDRGVYPFYAAKAEGTRIWDVDGNVYTDYGSHGALFLGHTHPDVVKAIQEYAALGPFAHDFTEINLKLVKKIMKMVPCAEVVDCVSSGTEATMGAIRYARAYTGRKKIIRFSGQFHGWADQLSEQRAGIPSEVFANMVEIRENDPKSLEETVKRENPAAVIFHFVHGSGGGGMVIGTDNPREFMKMMREITAKHDVLLIADEVITGFRNAPGGAQQYFDIDVDITALGKMVGGAIAGSGAIVGKEEIMETGNPKTTPRDRCVFTGGTFSGNPLNSAAGYAALDAIDKAHGELNEHANRLGEKFRNGLNEVFERHEFPAQAVGCCSANSVAFTELPVRSPTDYRTRSNMESLYKWHIYLATHSNIYTSPTSCIFISAIHTEKDIEHLIESTEEFVKEEKR